MEGIGDREKDGDIDENGNRFGNDSMCLAVITLKLLDH